jgi:hypothetical protein
MNADRQFKVSWQIIEGNDILNADGKIYDDVLSSYRDLEKLLAKPNIHSVTVTKVNA